MELTKPNGKPPSARCRHLPHITRLDARRDQSSISRLVSLPLISSSTTHIRLVSLPLPGLAVRVR